MATASRHDTCSTVAHRRGDRPVWCAFVIVSAVVLWAFPRPDRYVQPDARLRFAPPPAVAPDEEPAFAEHFADSGGPVGIAHSPSICELPDGRLAAVWYAGSREGARDVAIWMAEFDTRGRGAWGSPRIVMDVERATEELERKIRKIGNPVIFSDGAGRVWLTYVSVAVGGWSASSLNIKCSDDGGRTWGRSQRLTLSPFCNISELVRCPPVFMESGEIALPIYHEFLGKFPQLLWIDPQRPEVSWSKTRMTWGRRFLQPTVVPLSENHALAYYRHARPAGRLTLSETHDAGWTWGEPVELDLPNNDASVAALRLSDGSVLLAFHDDSRRRSNLRLAVSPNGRTDWNRLVTLDEDPKATFAYPYFLRARDGAIHLVYSWKMRRIRHVVFNEAWLRNPPQLPGKDGTT